MPAKVNETSAHSIVIILRKFRFSSCEEHCHGDHEALGKERKYRFDASARRAVHKIAAGNCRQPGLEASFAQRTGSGMRMLTYFINRAGKGLNASRRAALEHAKKLLSAKIEGEKRAHPHHRRNVA